MGKFRDAEKTEGGTYSQSEKPKPSVVKDVAKGGASGVAQGLNAPLHSGPDMREATGGLLGLALNKTGLMTPSDAQGVGSAFAGMLGAIPGANFINPWRGQTSAESNANLGIDYKPQTTAGNVAQRVGFFAPNALMGPSGGARGLIGQVTARAANVALPAAGSMAGEQAVKAAGGGEGAQAVGGMIGGGLGGLAASARLPKAPGPKPPSLEQLQAQRTAAYTAVDNAGVQFTPKAVGTLLQGMADDLAGAKFNPRLHPRAAAMINQVRKDHNGKPMTLSELDQLRQVIYRDVVAQADKGDRVMGQRLIQNIDEFIDAAGPGQVTSADPAKAFEALKRARETHKKVVKIEAVNAGSAKAQQRTASTGSGGNIDNATRQEMRKVLERGRAWTPDEKAALLAIVEGGKGQNLLRQAGKLSPSGNGLMQAGNLVAAAKTGGASLPVSAAAMAAKVGADQITSYRVKRLIEMIARGGPSAKAGEVQLTQLAKTDAQAQRALRLMAPIVLGVSTSAVATANQ